MICIRFRKSCGQNTYTVKALNSPIIYLRNKKYIKQIFVKLNLFIYFSWTQNISIIGPRGDSQKKDESVPIGSPNKGVIN